MGKIGILEMSLMQQGMTEEQKFLFQKQLDLRMKSKGVTFALALFLPGIDRMYLGEIGIGVLKILSFSGLGVWGFIDLFTAFGRTDGYNSRLAMEIAQIIKLQNS